jgi:hypothetical protein
MTDGRTGALADNFNNYSKKAFADDATNEDARKMLRSGFSLIVASCDDYFRSAGTTQRWVIVASDYVAAAGTLATSILALTHAGAAAVSATALGTSTVLAGASIYTKDFLFASENMDSVRTLTMNALHEHQKLVNATVTDNLDANDAVTAILDDQVICTLPHIATMVRSAIKNAKPEQSSSTETDNQTGGSAGGTAGGPTPPTQAPAQLVKGDAPVTASLKKLISPDLSPAQTEALYWLLFMEPTQQEKDGPICAQMLTLPPNNSPVIKTQSPQGKVTCTYRPWSNQQSVKDLLDKLSPASRSALVQNIAQARAIAATGGAAGTPGTPKTGGPIGEKSGGSGHQPSTHINVDIL